MQLRILIMASCNKVMGNESNNADIAKGMVHITAKAAAA